MSYVTEFMTFPVRLGKEERATEWMKTLVARQEECVATLDREAMHFESIFRSEVNGRVFLSWFSVQGQNAAHVSTSTHDIDETHIEFWRECIDTSLEPHKYQHIVNFIPPAVAETIAKREEKFLINSD